MDLDLKGTSQEDLGVLSTWRPRKFGALWQPVAACGSLWDGDPTPFKQVNKKIRSWKLPISGRIDHSMHRAWRPLGVRMLVNDDWRLLGVRSLVNDDTEEGWNVLSHARA